MPGVAKFRYPSDQCGIGAEGLGVGDRADHPVLRPNATVPVTFDLDLFSAIDNFNQNTVQEQTHDGLTVLLGCCFGAPQSRQVLSHSLYRGDFLQARRRWQLAPTSLVIGFQSRLVRQRFFPRPLKRAGHQSVFGFHGLVLAMRSLGGIGRPFQTLPPMPLQRCALSLHIRGNRQADLDGRRLHRRQDEVSDQPVEGRRRQRLAERLVISRSHVPALIAGGMAIVVIGRVHP